MAASMLRRRVLIPLAGMAALAGVSGCGLIPGYTPTPPATETLVPANAAVVTGSATYRERMMAPAGSVLKVVLADTSRADAPATELADWSISLDEGGVPKSFRLVTAEPLDPRMTYTVRATIHDADGTLLWTTDTAHRVAVTGEGTGAFDIGKIVMVMLAAYSPMAEPPPVDGTWKIVSVGGAPALGEKPLDLTFDKDGRVSGFGGCNRFGGSYKVTSGGLYFSPLMMTMMACLSDDMNAQEGKIGSALKGDVPYTFGEDGTLRLTGADGTEIVAAPAAKTLSLAGTQWSVFKMGSAGLFAGKEPSIAFSKDGKVTGTTGCNRLFGSYTQTGAQLVISELGMTKMACLEGGLMQQEMVFTSILNGESTVSVEAPASPGFPEKLVITGANGISFTAAPIMPRPAPPRPMADRKSLENGEWVVEDINRGGVIDNSRLTLSLGQDGRMTGSTNCNTFTGSFKSTSTRLVFSDVAVTERACLAEALQNQEAAYLAILNTSAADGLAWSYTEDGALELKTNEGKRLLLRR